MNGRRLARLGWVVLCDLGFLFVFAQGLWPFEGPDSFFIALFCCSACIGGIVLEILKFEYAFIPNIGIPLLLFVYMASSPLWISRSEYEAVGFMLIVSIVPLAITILTTMAYWLIDIEPNSPPLHIT